MKNKKRMGKTGNGGGKMKQAVLPRVSVITTVYNTERYLPKCIESICNQTYKNLQIIVVNDASKGEVKQIIKPYLDSDKRIAFVNSEKNLGLFHARQRGAKLANGDYICFVDSDDYLGADYIRSMAEAAMEHQADIVKANFVLTDGERYYIHGHINHQPEQEWNEEEVLKQYFAQEGLDFSWHTVWNKLYKKSLWDQCMPYYAEITSHLIMAEDFAYSTPLFAFAKKVVSISADEYFYLQRAEASTGIEHNTKKFQKNILDLRTSFHFVENFLKQVEKWGEYEGKFDAWKKRYARFWYDNINNAGFGEIERRRMENLLASVLEQEKILSSQKEDHYFYSNTIEWNRRLWEAKERIISSDTEVISFDIFDTLIQRPLLEPTDLFRFMELSYQGLLPDKGYHFAKFRKDAEACARENCGKEEIELWDIYLVMQKKYGLSKQASSQLMDAEIAMELKMCYPRKCAKQLYKLALSLGKKIIVTSDMYLPKDVIEEILQKNGYEKYESLYLSSDTGRTKASGSLYEYIVKDMKVAPGKILHIGDNWTSDIEMAANKGIGSIFFPKASEVFKNNLEFGGYPAGASWGYVLNSWNAIHNNACSLEFLGVSCMYAVVANEYFDNPYKSFQKNSDFNASPYYMGLYALGMHLFGITEDVIKTYGSRRKIHFVSRDGFLCKKIYDRIGTYYGASAESNYLHVSRKALLPTSFHRPEDFFAIEDGISKDCILLHSPKSILENFLHIKEDRDIRQSVEREGIAYEGLFLNEQEFEEFLEVLGKQQLVYQRLEEYSRLLREYFNGLLEDGDVLFDIGYNGTGQYLLSKLLQKKIDGYYVYLNKEKATQYAKERGYQVSTFYDGTPGVSGTIREFFFSECVPSCIGYGETAGGIVPVFEESSISYQEQWVADSIRRGVECFTDLMIKHFADYLHEFYLRSHDCSVPFEYLMHKTKDMDRWTFHCCRFEDDVFYGGSMNLYRVWSDAVMFYYSPDGGNVQGMDAEAMQRYSEIKGIYSDGIAVAMFKKMNRIAPFGSRRREAIKKILRIFI